MAIHKATYIYFPVTAVNTKSRNMNCFQLTLLILIQISSVLTMSGSGAFTSINSSGDYSGEQSTTTSPPSPTPFSCPCTFFPPIVTIIGYSPCSFLDFLSPRECDVFIQVALRRAFSSLFSKVELPLFNNYCFWPFPFNDDKVSFFN